MGDAVRRTHLDDPDGPTPDAPQVGEPAAGRTIPRIGARSRRILGAIASRRARARRGVRREQAGLRNAGCQRRSHGLELRGDRELRAGRDGGPADSGSRPGHRRRRSHRVHARLRDGRRLGDGGHSADAVHHRLGEPSRSLRSPSCSSSRPRGSNSTHRCSVTCPGSAWRTRKRRRRSQCATCSTTRAVSPPRPADRSRVTATRAPPRWSRRFASWTARRSPHRWARSTSTAPSTTRFWGSSCRRCRGGPTRTTSSSGSSIRSRCRTRTPPRPRRSRTALRPATTTGSGGRGQPTCRTTAASSRRAT